MLRGKKILLIINGSISAYKALHLIRLLKKENAELNCVMTKGAKKFITTLSVSSLLEKNVYTDLFNEAQEVEMDHILLSKMHDLIIIAPASANFISKSALGLADCLASTILLATKSKVFYFPAMNVNMLNNIIMKEHISALEKRGCEFFLAQEGVLACGDHGRGRLIEPEEIKNKVLNYFKKKSLLKGIRALVTAGPTVEPIDPIRYISNKSSGAQGYALAESLANQGAEVSLISGPTDLPKPENISKYYKVQTADEMLNLCLKKVPKDLFISVAAVTDWKLQHTKNKKIKKQKSPPIFNLQENPDILASICDLKNRPRVVIGFAAETDSLIKNAKLKLEKKKCDIIIANEVNKNNKPFGSNMNTVHIISKHFKTKTYKKMTKSGLSSKLIKEVISPMLLKCRL
tara:strand:- start:182 stop:1393 length:1212 start_codon:yes stop_codon:yes gene_type:complete